MSEISTFKANRFKEAEYKRHELELKKLKAENRREYNKESKRGKEQVTTLSDEYSSKFTELKAKLEKKLDELRDHQQEMIKLENSRLDNELKDLKTSHKDQVNELKETHENQIEQINKSHERTLANARQKFMKEQMKWEKNS